MENEYAFQEYHIGRIDLPRIHSNRVYDEIISDGKNRNMIYWNIDIRHWLTSLLLFIV